MIEFQIQLKYTCLFLLIYLITEKFCTFQVVLECARCLWLKSNFIEFWIWLNYLYWDERLVLLDHNKANLRDLTAATGLVFLLKIGFRSLIFGPMWPGNLMEDLKNNRAPPLHYVKLCASFQSHQWIQTGVTVWKRSIWVRIGDFLSPVTSKFDGWPWKSIGHIFYATLSFVLHFIAIYQFKMELQSRNAKFGSKSAIFCSMWPWNLMDDLQQGKSEGFESCDRPIVRKRPIWVKIGDVLSYVTLKFDGWPWKTIGHLYYATSSSRHHFVAIGEFKLELQSGNAQFGSKSMIFLALWPCNLTYDLEKQ